MANKAELLKDMKDYLSFEEDIIKGITDFYQALGWRAVVKQEYHNEIEKGLETLKEDSEKHVGMLVDITKYIEGSNKNGF
jgi:hypothetical protein